jgi:hypothetical protein
LTAGTAKADVAFPYADANRNGYFDYGDRDLSADFSNVLSRGTATTPLLVPGDIVIPSNYAFYSYNSVNATIKAVGGTLTMLGAIYMNGANSQLTLAADTLKIGAFGNARWPTLYSPYILKLAAPNIFLNQANLEAVSQLNIAGSDTAGKVSVNSVSAFTRGTLSVRSRAISMYGMYSHNAYNGMIPAVRISTPAGGIVDIRSSLFISKSLSVSGPQTAYVTGNYFYSKSQTSTYCFPVYSYNYYTNTCVQVPILSVDIRSSGILDFRGSRIMDKDNTSVWLPSNYYYLSGSPLYR